MQTQSILWFMVACAVGVSSPCAAQMTSGQAFEAGKSSGGTEHTQQVFDGVGNAKAGEVMQGFTTDTPNQSSYWGGVGTVLQPLVTGGSERIDECRGTGLESRDASQKQHCEAVNALSSQPSRRPTNLLEPNDPLLATGNAIANDPEAIAGRIDGIYADCTTSTTEHPATVTRETCTEFTDSGARSCTVGLEVVVRPDTVYTCRESLWKINASTCTYGNIIRVGTAYNYQCNASTRPETHKCKRGFSPNVGITVGNSDIMINHSSNVSPYSSQTYIYNVHLDGEPGRFVLTKYNADDWGQLWINDVKVYQNDSTAMFYRGDWRYSTVVTNRSDSLCGTPSSWSITRCFVFAPDRIPASGRYDNFWDNDGPLSFTPNLDITAFLKEGDNKIEVVCINAQRDGDCLVNIIGGIKRVTYLGSLVNNECVEYEGRL